MNTIKIDKYIKLPFGEDSGYQYVDKEGKSKYANKYETILSLVLRDLGYEVELNKIEVFD